MHITPISLRDSEARGVGQVQHRPVPHAGGGRRVRGIEQDLHLVTVQRFDHCVIVTLDWNRMDLAREVETSRYAELEVAEE